MSTRRSAPATVRRVLLSLMLLAVAVLGLAACGDDSGTAGGSSNQFQLRIESSGGGATAKLDGKEGSTITLTDAGGIDLTFTVGEVGDESARFTTSVPVTEVTQFGGQARTEFTVSKGQPVNLTTPNATTWTVTYEELSVE